MNTTLKTKDILAEARENAKITHAQERVFYDSFIKTIHEELSAGNDVRLNGLGILSLHTTNSRIGRNPMTGEKINIPSRNRVRFRPSKTLQNVVS